MGTMPPHQMPKLIDRISKQQPLVLAYLLATGEQLFNQDERELFLYLGVVVWQIMSRGNKPLSKVTEATLDRMEENNMKMLEYLEGESEADFIEAVEKMLKNYNQQEVLKYVIEALMEDEEDFFITDESKGLMLLYLKTVIDCFDK
jgi:hypothetical protein